MKRLLLVLAAACQPPGAGTPTTCPAPPPHVYLLTDLVGGWRWQLRTSESGTTRVETEAWRFRPSPGIPTQLSGRYVRSVEVRSDDRVPFACNQRPRYRQRATYDVTVEATASAFAVRETDYQAEPSPCDHGFRHLGAYTAELAGNRFALHWDSGDQTLWQTDAELTDLPASPWPASPELTGPWRYAVKVATHDRMSFYNPKQHPAFAKDGGKVIYFEGTYTHDFSGNPDTTPRYEYNQVMYRLDLADARLRLPAAQ